MKDTHLCMMPTLETEDVFDVMQMRELATTLVGHPCHNRIIALRIGGNDLMNVMSLRRPRNLTLYDSPMGYVIKMLVAVFGSRDFSLTSPVCEHIDDHNVMEQELALDMAHGLVGKTAIHPNQIAKIERALMVTPADHADALRSSIPVRPSLNRKVLCANRQPTAAGHQGFSNKLRFMASHKKVCRKVYGW